MRGTITAGVLWLVSACAGGAIPVEDPTPLPAPVAFEPLTTDDLVAADGLPFALTYYWVAIEQRHEKRQTFLYDKRCRRLAKVSHRFAKRAALEGTGRTRDGRILNAWGPCNCQRSPCFFEVDRRTTWGLGVKKRPLFPFRSVAVDPGRVEIGSRLYVEELDGLEMPGPAPWGGFVHDGCVTADDRGQNVQGNQIDFFTGAKDAYLELWPRLRKGKVTVAVDAARCG